MMSFNVQLNLPKANGKLTSAAYTRVCAVAAEMTSYLPDVIGLQEDTKTWNDELATLLDGYTAVQDTTVTVSGAERCAIWYKSSLECLASGYQPLLADGAETVLTVADLTDGDGKYDLSPEELEVLGLSADSANSDLTKERKYTQSNGNVIKYHYLATRRMTYAVLNINGRPVICVNTHLQERSQDAAYITPALTKLRNYARMAQFDMIQKKIGELQEDYPDAVVTLTGDFNDVVGSEVYTAAAEIYRDSATSAAQVSGEEGTWNAYFGGVNTQGDCYPNTNVSAQSKISLDFCWVSKNADIVFYCSGLGYATVIAEDGKMKTVYTSDHRLIVSDIRFSFVQN